MCHFIVQFLKGDRIYFAQEDFIIPNSNRLIITYDTLNEDLRPDRGTSDMWKTMRKSLHLPLFGDQLCYARGPIGQVP